MEYRHLPHGTQREKFSVIGLVNKYYNPALAGDEIAANHYTKLGTKADACLSCGHCEDRCPFGVKQMSRMRAIDAYFSGICSLGNHR